MNKHIFISAALTAGLGCMSLSFAAPQSQPTISSQQSTISMICTSDEDVADQELESSESDILATIEANMVGSLDGRQNVIIQAEPPQNASNVTATMAPNTADNAANVDVFFLNEVDSQGTIILAPADVVQNPRAQSPLVQSPNASSCDEKTGFFNLLPFGQNARQIVVVSSEHGGGLPRLANPVAVGGSAGKPVERPQIFIITNEAPMRSRTEGQTLPFHLPMMGNASWQNLSPRLMRFVQGGQASGPFQTYIIVLQQPMPGLPLPITPAPQRR